MNTQVHPFQEFIQTPGDQKKKKKKFKTMYRNLFSLSSNFHFQIF